MHEAVPYEIRQALGMPDADLAAASERIRTLRQTELAAEHLLRAGRLLPKAGEPVQPASSRKRVAARACLVFAVLAAMLAFVLGWAAVVDQPQGATWKSAVQSQAHPARDVEQLLRESRRFWASRSN